MVGLHEAFPAPQESGLLTSRPARRQVCIETKTRYFCRRRECHGPNCKTRRRENHRLLTVVRHADVEALLKAAVLAFVARLLVNATVEVAVIVDKL